MSTGRAAACRSAAPRCGCGSVQPIRLGYPKVGLAFLLDSSCRKWRAWPFARQAAKNTIQRIESRPLAPARILERHNAVVHGASGPMVDAVGDKITMTLKLIAVIGLCGGQ